MASNSEANLSSDFDIDEVINWDEQNYSSKAIDFPIGLSSNAKTSQHGTAVTLPNLGLSGATSQGTQNSNSLYSALFGGISNNPSVVQNTKNHGFSSRQAMVSQDGLSFPSENISIPAIATSNSSLLQFAPNLVGQNSSLTNQLCMSQMQNVQNSDNLINDEVSFDDNDDLIEGPLDRIVDQIMDRQISERITEPPPLSGSYDDDTPVITYSNRQTKSSQLSNRVSPQNVPSRSVLSPSAPTRNVTLSNVPSPNITMRNSPSPNVPTLQVSSSNPPQRNVQNITSTKIITPNISPPNVPSQNIPSTLQNNNNHSFSTILSSQSSEQGMVPSHPKYRLQSPVTISSSIGNTLSQAPPALKPITNMSIAQTELSTNSLYQSSGQNNSQSYPGLTLQNSNQTMMQQTSGTSFSPSNMQSKPVWQESGSSLEDLLRMQKSIQTSSSSLDRVEFTNELARSSPIFSSVLTSKIPGNEHSHNVQSLLASNIGTDSSTALFPGVSETTSDLHLKISSPNPVGMNLNGQNITSISQYNRTNGSYPKSVFVLPQNVSFPAQAVSSFSSNRTPSPLSSGQNDELQITSTVQAHTNPTSQTLTTPRRDQHVSMNQFFQNSSNVIQSTADMNRNDIFSTVISKPKNVIVSNNQNLSQPRPKPQLPQANSQQSKPVFKICSSATILSPTQTSQSFVFKTEANPISTKPAGIKTIKITSPSPNTAGIKYPTVGFSPNPSPKAVSIQPPRATTIRLKSPTTAGFPAFRLTQEGGLATGSNPSSTKPMVFTLAPGAQATLKGLPTNLKDKLTGRPVIFVQSSGKPINTPKPQPMKIVFVNDGSIKQVVSGPVKSKAPQSSAVSVISQRPGLAVAKITLPLPEAKTPTSASITTIQEPEADSPSSVNSTDSDSIPIAALKQNEEFKRKENESKEEQKSRGKKRRKDPNRPVKPLSSFQRFFQATQPTIRQQNPQLTFAEVSKTIKEMWENLPSKDKRVYQDAWRMERVQYKKAMDDYNAGLSDFDFVDAPAAKQTKHAEDESSTANPIPVSSFDIPAKIGSSIVVSPSTTTTSPAVSTSIPPPRSTGKPLAMMAEMANKTKLASAQAAKATAMTKSLHLGKNKASNGVEDSVTLVVKKKAKINPIPKKLCIRANCNKAAKTTKERGTMFCSDDCLMRYCRSIFRSWVETRRQALKSAT